MNSKFKESSVDPDEIETSFDGDNTTGARQRGSTEYPSLPTSDLENDAVPFSPDVNLAPSMFDQVTQLPRHPFEGATAPPLRDLPAESSRTDQRHATGNGAHHGHGHTSAPSHGDSRCAAQHPGPQQRETYQPAPQQKGACARPPSTTPVQEETRKGDIAVPDPSRETVMYDAVIISHEDDAEKVNELKRHLNSLMLFDEKLASVAIEDDGPDRGKGEVSYFEDWLKKAQIMFFFMTQRFCEERFCCFKKDVALSESFFYEGSKKEFVIPIFLRKKHKLPFLTPSIRAIKGIEYLDCNWTDSVAERFKQNLNSARLKRQEDSVDEKMSNLTIN